MRPIEIMSPPDPAAPRDWPILAARHLLTMPAAEAISIALSDIGELADVDRAWMFAYDASLLRFRNTHEWCREGVVSHVGDLQDAPVTMIAWLHRSLARGEAVAINDVSRLPRQARALQVEMLRQGDKSVLSVPVFRVRPSGCWTLGSRGNTLGLAKLKRRRHGPRENTSLDDCSHSQREWVALASP